MGISSVESINQKLSTEIRAAQDGQMVRSDHSQVAARQLKTAEDLSAFYGHNDGPEANAVVATAVYMASVAVGALTFAAAAGGPETQMHNTSANWDFDVSDFSVEELLNARYHALT